MLPSSLSCSRRSLLLHCQPFSRHPDLLKLTTITVTCIYNKFIKQSQEPDDRINYKDGFYQSGSNVTINVAAQRMKGWKYIVRCNLQEEGYLNQSRICPAGIRENDVKHRVKKSETKTPQIKITTSFKTETEALTTPNFRYEALLLPPIQEQRNPISKARSLMWIQFINFWAFQLQKGIELTHLKAPTKCRVDRHWRSGDKHAYQSIETSSVLCYPAGYLNSVIKITDDLRSRESNPEQRRGFPTSLAKPSLHLKSRSLNCCIYAGPNLDADKSEMGRGCSAAWETEPTSWKLEKKKKKKKQKQRDWVNNAEIPTELLRVPGTLCSPSSPSMHATCIYVCMYVYVCSGCVYKKFVFSKLVSVARLQYFNCYILLIFYPQCVHESFFIRKKGDLKLEMWNIWLKKNRQISKKQLCVCQVSYMFF